MYPNIRPFVTQFVREAITTTYTLDGDTTFLHHSGVLQGGGCVHEFSACPYEKHVAHWLEETSDERMKATDPFSGTVVDVFFDGFADDLFRAVILGALRAAAFSRTVATVDKSLDTALDERNIIQTRVAWNALAVLGTRIRTPLSVPFRKVVCNVFLA